MRTVPEGEKNGIECCSRNRGEEQFEKGNRNDKVWPFREMTAFIGARFVMCTIDLFGATVILNLLLKEPAWASYRCLLRVLDKYVMETSTKTKQTVTIRDLAKRVAAVEASLAKMENVQPFTIQIDTLVSQRLKLKKSIPVLVQPGIDDYVVSFLDANIGMSGETLPEAVDNLKDVMASTFRMLLCHSADKLGKAPTNQLAVLKEFIELH